MSGRRLWALFAAAMLPAMLLTFPLRVALPLLGISPPLAADDVQGTLWHGQLQAARWNHTALGTLALRLSPWPLARGELHLHVSGPRLTGTLVQGRRSGVQAVRGSLDLPVSALPLRLHFEDAGAVFDRRACRRATGAVSIELSQPQPSGPQAPILRATPRCDGDQWLAQFSDGPTGAGAELRLGADGRFLLLLRDAAAGPGTDARGPDAVHDGLLPVAEGHLR